MAERGWTSNVLCRYFVNGVCRDGSNCRFSHDRVNAEVSNVCQYYLRGSCFYGNRCRYEHVRPAQSSRVPQNNRSNVTNNNKRTSQQDQGLVATGGPSQLPRDSAANASNLTVLRKVSAQPRVTRPSTWADAPEFVPSSAGKNERIWEAKSYASVAGPVISEEGAESKLSTSSSSSSSCDKEGHHADLDSILCPYAIMGDCQFGDKCIYLHGTNCELCGQACMHPTDAQQRKGHLEECMKEHERDMELSFAVARSKDKSCGICMDIIMEKIPSSERRFGILPNCTHVFCLSCIRKWRCAKQFESRTIRSCPECRTPSDFITPSKYWVEAKEDKDHLINNYKMALSLKPCKYFKQGRGECPFAGNCFYLHAYPDGRKAELPPPQPRRRRNEDGEWERPSPMFLWDFVEERDNRWLLYFDLDDELDSLLGIFASSDDDSLDWTEDEDYDDEDLV